MDKEVVKAITDSFGKGIWNRALVVLTHAQLSPPDGLPYEEFVSKRSEALLKVVRLGAGLKKQDAQVSNLFLPSLVFVFSSIFFFLLYWAFSYLVKALDRNLCPV